VSCELKEQSVKQWQNEWERSTKDAITKSFFPNIVDRLKLRINASPNFTAIVTGHGNITTYLYRYKIIESLCNKGEQTVDHIIFVCKLQEHERDRLKAVVTQSEKWPVSKDKLGLKYYKNFKKFTDNIVLNNE
jgi:hypothetical protein